MSPVFIIPHVRHLEKKNKRPLLFFIAPSMVEKKLSADVPVKVYAVGGRDACSYVMRTDDDSLHFCCTTLEGLKAEMTAEIRARIHFLTRQEMDETPPIGTSSVSKRPLPAFSRSARPLNEDEQLFLKS